MKEAKAQPLLTLELLEASGQPNGPAALPPRNINNIVLM
jgi:hypothetical protein